MALPPSNLRTVSSCSWTSRMNSFIFSGNAKYGSPSSTRTMPITHKKYSTTLLTSQRIDAEGIGGRLGLPRQIADGQNEDTHVECEVNYVSRGDADPRHIQE